MIIDARQAALLFGQRPSTVLGSWPRQGAPVLVRPGRGRGHRNLYDFDSLEAWWFSRIAQRLVRLQATRDRKNAKERRQRLLKNTRPPDLRNMAQKRADRRASKNAVDRRRRARLAALRAVLVGVRSPVHLVAPPTAPKPPRSRLPAGEKVKRMLAGQKKATARLADSYVVKKIKRQCGLPARCIPQLLIETKRAHLLLWRLTRGRGQS